MKRIILLEKFDILNDAIQYGKVLCKLGYGVLIETVNGQYGVSYQPKV